MGEIDSYYKTVESCNPTGNDKISTCYFGIVVRELQSSTSDPRLSKFTQSHHPNIVNSPHKFPTVHNCILQQFSI